MQDCFFAVVQAMNQLMNAVLAALGLAILLALRLNAAGSLSIVG